MNIYKTLFYCLIIILMHSCVGPGYPGLRTNPIMPLMIQPPMPIHSVENSLPESSNFVHSYTKHKKSKTNSNFGALVRIIEFEYDIADTFKISPRITTGFDEGEMTGLFTIIVDQYELTYENGSTQIREYVEEIGFESSKSSGRNQSLNQQLSPTSIQNSLNEKPEKIHKRSQLYNTATFRLESEDTRLIQRSKTLYYIIQLQNCELIIYPSNEQIKILKKMITQYFSP